MESLLKTQARRSLWGCLIYLLTSVGVAFIVVFSALVAALAPVKDQDRIIVGAVVFGLLSFLSIAGIIVGGLILRKRRLKILDDALAPLALQASGYLTVGRQYHGQYDGRRLDAFFWRGPHFELYLDAKSGTRLGVGLPNSLGRAVASMVHREEVDVEGVPWKVYATNAAWARALFQDPEVREQVDRLIRSAGASERPSLTLTPDALHLILSWTALDLLHRERVSLLLRDLRALAERVESQPPPPTLEEPSRLERNARGQRQGPGFFLMVALVTVVLSLLLSGIIAAIVLMTQP